jgi:spore germination protein YaaH
MYYKFLLLFLITDLSLTAQQEGKEITGIHQVESEYYSSITKDIPLTKEGSAYPISLNSNISKDLTRRVLGWHPYWASATAYQAYDYNALTHIAYFSYEVDTATGGYLSIHDWNTTPIISYAHQRGTKVLLTVTNFGSSRNTRLLTDTVRQNTLINNVIILLKNRNGDGVNFDLESVSSSQKANLVSFMTRAATRIKAQVPGAEISMATPAVDWSGSWNFKSLSEICDYLIVMGYDYYWRNSTTAGPVAPLEGETYNIKRTIDTYLNSQVAPAKLMLGVPWYGYDWPVVNSSRKAASAGSATARIYTAADNLAKTHGHFFDQVTKVPWVSYSASSQWRQLWYDDVQSLGLKYGLVNSKELGGIGIWALSYDGGREEIWGIINSSFVARDTTSDRILNIYPNPSKESSTIIYSLTSKQMVRIEIFDTRGRIISVIKEAELDPGIYTDVVSLPEDVRGIYICVFRSEKSIDTRKLVIVR